jgi:hypothetical protein
MNPSWSPDGKKIAFNSDRFGNDEIFIIDVEYEPALMENEEGEEIDTISELTEVPRVEAEGGYIEKDSYVGNGEHVYAGDTERDNMCKGSVSFDITGFKDTEVGEAVLTFVNKQVLNDPSDFGDLIIASHWYGDNPLVMIDYDNTGTKIQSSDSPDFICSNDTLKSELQKAINELNEDRTRFQVLVYFTSDNSNGNGVSDGWEYNQEDIILEIGVVE